MKTSLLVISMMLVLGTALTGCATSAALEQVQAEQKLIDAKADQALQDSQVAKAEANAAKLKADDAVKRAEEREKIADEKSIKADEIFRKSMKK